MSMSLNATAMMNSAAKISRATRTAVAAQPGSFEYALIEVSPFCDLLSLRSMQEVVDAGAVFLCRARADEHPLHVAAREQHDRRHRAHAVLSGEPRVVVDVDCRDGHAVGVLVGEPLDDGRYRPARSAPNCREIHDGRLLRLEHVVREVALAYRQQRHPFFLHCMLLLRTRDLDQIAGTGAASQPPPS